jgi:hypothetical protein
MCVYIYIYIYIYINKFTTRQNIAYNPFTKVSGSWKLCNQGEIGKGFLEKMFELGFNVLENSEGRVDYKISKYMIQCRQRD